MKPELTEFDQRLLNDFQRDFPLSPAPYAEIARRLGVTENDVLERLKALTRTGAVSRVGAVVRPNTVGVSTLAAMAVPMEALESVAALVNEYSEVNHNYERENHLNLWFVATSTDVARLQGVLDEISVRTGYEVLSFPLEEDYHIDLGFDLQWN